MSINETAIPALGFYLRTSLEYVPQETSTKMLTIPLFLLVNSWKQGSGNKLVTSYSGTLPRSKNEWILAISAIKQKYQNKCSGKKGKVF